MTTPLPTPLTAIKRKALAKGETLFRQGDLSFAIFAVRHGQVRLLRHLADGSTVPLYVAHAGDTFSEAALFSEIYHCDAVADEDTEIEIHPKEVLSQSLAENPQAARAFMIHLAHQVIALRSRLEIRNIRSAKERVVQFIQLEMNEGERSVTFTSPLKDIAGDIGLTHETLYRTLAKLERSGKITRNGRTITLLDQA